MLRLGSLKTFYRIKKSTSFSLSIFSEKNKTVSRLDRYSSGEDFFYRNVGVENDDVGIFAALKRALMGEAHNFGGCFGEHFYGVGYGYSRFLYRYTDKSVRRSDTSGERASVHQLTHAVFNDKFGALHKSVSLISSRKGEAVGNECDALWPLYLIYQLNKLGRDVFTVADYLNEHIVAKVSGLYYAESSEAVVTGDGVFVVIFSLK